MEEEQKVERKKIKLTQIQMENFELINKNIKKDHNTIDTLR
jgi:hypothetical protein